MRHRHVPILLGVALIGSLVTVSAVQGGPVNPTTRTVQSGSFEVQWSLTNPEEIVSLSWKKSPNLTHTAVISGCPDDLLFFGDAFGTAEDQNFVAPVGWGTTGTWAADATGVRIASSAKGCYGTSGIPVTTNYTQPASGGPDQFKVVRRFAFGSTAFDKDLRPYIPRLYPNTKYGLVVFPNAAGTSLANKRSAACDHGCQIADWNGLWYALYDPAGGSGMVVRHQPSAYRVSLWIDQDGAPSNTTSTSVLLARPTGGFVGTLVDVQSFCFFDRSSWKPSLRLPSSCTKPASPAAPATGVVQHAWMSHVGGTNPITSLHSAAALQANYRFKSVPVNGAALRVTWLRDGRSLASIPKERASLVTSVLTSSPRLANGHYQAKLFVRPPGGTFHVIATASAAVG